MPTRRGRARAEHPRGQQPHLPPRHLPSPGGPKPRRERAQACCGKPCGDFGVYRAPVHRRPSQRQRPRARACGHPQDPPGDLPHSLASLGSPEALHRGPCARTRARTHAASVQGARSRESPAEGGGPRSSPRDRQLCSLGPKAARSRTSSRAAAELGRCSRRVRQSWRGASAAWQRPRLRGCRAGRARKGAPSWTANSARRASADGSEPSSQRPRISWKLQELRPGGTPPPRPSRRRACGRNTSSLSTRPEGSANAPGAATETPPLASVGGSKRSIETSEVSSPPYPCRPATENAFHNNWRSAKPSNHAHSSGNSQVNGRRFRSPRTPARGVTSLPAAPRAATPVRFDLCSDESANAATRTTIGASKSQQPRVPARPSGRRRRGLVRAPLRRARGIAEAAHESPPALPVHRRASSV